MSSRPQLRIMFVGDISAGEHYFSLGHGPRSSQARGTPLLGDLGEVLAMADLAVGNLEGPLSDEGLDPENPWSLAFRGTSDAATSLAESGLKIASVANNHSLHHGINCFKSTIERLERAGVKPVGLANEEPEGGTVIHIGGGMRVGLIAASEVPDERAPNQCVYRRLEPANILKSVRKLRATGCNLICLFLHWGEEPSAFPNRRQIEFVDELLDCGADIVAGCHPHVLHPVSHDGRGVVATSLGNCVFDLPFEPSYRQSAILDVAYRDGARSVQLWPFEIDRNGIPRLSGDPVEVPEGSTTNLYEFPDSFEGLYLRKVRYFLLNLHRGRTKLKLQFLADKLRGAPGPPGTV